MAMRIEPRQSFCLGGSDREKGKTALSDKGKLGYYTKVVKKKCLSEKGKKRLRSINSLLPMERQRRQDEMQWEAGRPKKRKKEHLSERVAEYGGPPPQLCEKQKEKVFYLGNSPW